MNYLEYVAYKGRQIEIKNGELALINKGIENISEIKGLEDLTNLHTLYLYNNLITDIHGLESLTSLERLSLRNNNIKEIKGLEKLTRLRQLYLENNQIAEIKGLKNLTNLETLHLNNNQITEIKGLESLKVLQKLYLKDNPILKVLLEDLEGLYPDGNAKKPQRFVEYCRQQKRNEIKEKNPLQIKKALIYLIYATKDSDLLQIPKIAETLTNKPEIEDILYWEEDMKEDIYKYMNYNVGRCDMCVIFWAQNALSSKAVEMEWHSALKLEKFEIPIFRNGRRIPQLTIKLGVKFDKHNLSRLIEDIYLQILKRLNISDNG